MRLKTAALSLLALLAVGLAFADNFSGPAGRFISVGGSIDLLGDVNTSGKSNGNCLVYNTSTGKWVPGVCGSGGGGASSLSVNSGGVQISSPTAVLNFSSSTFNVSQGPVGTSTVTINFSSITAKGNAFNAANKLLLLDGSGLVPNALLSAQVSLFGDSVDLPTQTQGNYVEEVSAGPGIALNPSAPGHGTQPIFSLSPGTLAGDQSWADGTANTVTWRWVVPGVAPRFIFSDGLIQTLSEFDAPTFVGTTMSADTISAGVSMTSQGKNVAQYSDTVIAGSTVAYSSGTIQNLNTTTLKFNDGTTMTTASAGGAGGFWVGKATSSLDMNGFAVTGSTLVVTSSFSVTGATETIFGTTYVRASSTTVGSGQKLLVYTAAAGKMTESIQDIITNGMTTTSTDTKSGALIMQSSFTLPSVTQMGNPASAGQVAYSTSTAGPNWGGTVLYDGKQRMYGVMTATDSVPLAGWVPTYDATGRVLWEAQSGSGGAGTPGGSNTQIQFNNAGVFNGVAVATYNATTQLLTYSSGSVHVNVSSETLNNVRLVLSGTSAIQYPDGTVQTSSPTAGGGSGTITGVTAGYGLSGGGTSGGVTLNLVTNSTSYVQNSNTLLSGTTFYVSSGSVAGQFRVTDPSNPRNLTIYPDPTFGLGGFVHFVQAYAASGGGGSVGPYRIVVSSESSLPGLTSNDQSTLLFYPPGNATYPTGAVAFGFGNNTALTMTPSGTTISGLKYPTADGSAGQFMKTDGSGNLSFGTASGGTSTLAVTTGTSTGFVVATASPTAVINFSSDTFTVSLTGSATAYVQSKAVSLSTGVTGTLSGSSVSGGTFGAVNGSALTSLTPANISNGTLPGAVVLGYAVSASTGLTGTLAAAQAPALTGFVTSSAGSLATSQGQSVSLSTGVTGTLSGSSVSGGTFGAVNGSALTSLSPGNLTAGAATHNVMVDSVSASGVTSGTYGDASHVSSVTINLDGRVTGAANVAIALTGNAVSGGTFGAVNGSALTNLTGANVGSGVPAANIASGPLGNQVIASSLAVVATAGTYGSTTIIPTITINAQGQVIALSSNTAAAGGAQDFDLKDSTGSMNRSLQMSTNSVVNVSSVGFSGTYDSGNNPWSLGRSTYSMVNSGAAGQTFTGASSVTVNGLQFWAPANSTMTGTLDLYMNSSSSNSGGFKFSMVGPASPVYFEMTGGGAGASSTTSNLSQQASALNTNTQTFLGTYTSGAMWFHFGFQLITGATAGYVNVKVMGATGAGNNFINSESALWATLK